MSVRDRLAGTSVGATEPAPLPKSASAEGRLVAVNAGLSLAGASPDADAVFRRQIQRLARLYLEGLIPRVKIARDPSPLDRRRMRIGGDALRQILLAIVTPPHLRPAEEEALVTGRAVDQIGRASCRERWCQYV